MTYTNPHTVGLLQESHPSDVYLSENYLVLDFETGGPDRRDPVARDNTLLLAGWIYSGVYKSCWGNEYEQEVLLEDIQHADFIVAHNAKFELQWLKRCGLELRDVVVWCTMVAEKVYAGNRQWPLSLDHCLARYELKGKENLVSKMLKSDIDPADIPVSLLEKYCRVDVVQTAELFKQQRKRLNELELMPALFTACSLTPLLADIEFNGLHLDKEKVKQEHDREVEKYQILSLQFEKLTGGINPRSTKQMATYLYTTLAFSPKKDHRGDVLRTAKGSLPTDALTVAGLKAKTAAQKEFITCFKELRKTDTRLNKYLKKFQDCCSMDGGILLGQYNQTVTQTMRLSSSGRKHKVQLQNIDRGYKALFTTRLEGWKIGSWDYGQLEFRVAVFLAQDSQGMNDIDTGFDVHQFTADFLTGAGEPTSRQSAKGSTFRPLFGGSSGAKAVKAYCNEFKKKYAEITNTQQGWVAEVVNTKQLVTATGLIFHWPDVKVQSSGFVTHTQNIYNYPIQYLAGGCITPIGAVSLWKKTRGMQSFLINTVHDSIVLEIHPGEVAACSKLAEEAMTTDVYNHLKDVHNIEFNVPLKVEASIENYWKG